MTRFENHVHHRELYEMGREFVLQFIRSYKKAPVKIILDFDDSNSNTYGVQEQTLFNDYYGEYCYMPLFIFEGYSGKLVQPLLRPDRVNKRLNVFGLMKRIITEIRKYWKETIIIVRGDSMFCNGQRSNIMCSSSQGLQGTWHLTGSPNNGFHKQEMISREMGNP